MLLLVFPVLTEHRITKNKITIISFFFSFLFLSLRLQYTTKGTKALRLLGDGSRKHDDNTQQDQTFKPNESVRNKHPARGNTQRRLLLKNGEVNISRYIITF